MVRVICTSVRDIVHYVVRIQAESLCNWLQALGTERALCVNVECLTLTTALRDRKLASDAQSVAQLSLACAELSKELRDGASLNTAYTNRMSLYCWLVAER